MKDPLWWEFFSTTLQNASVSQTKHGLNSILTNYKLLPPPHKDSAFSGTEIEYIKILYFYTEPFFRLKIYIWRNVRKDFYSSKLRYSCNNITTTLIQISLIFYFGFYSKFNHDNIIKTNSF